MTAPALTAIRRPYMKGLQATRADGITVEVVEVYQGEWTVFLTRDDHVVACSLEAQRLGNRMDKRTALRIAMRILRELEA